jgi:hypothetical protein
VYFFPALLWETPRQKYLLLSNMWSNILVSVSPFSMHLSSATTENGFTAHRTSKEVYGRSPAKDREHDLKVEVLL